MRRVDSSALWHPSRAGSSHSFGRTQRTIRPWGRYAPCQSQGSIRPSSRWVISSSPCEYIEDVTVYVDGTKQDQARYSVTNGMIVFHDGVAPAAGAVVKADYTYYFKVRFKDSSAGITAIFNNFNQSKTFKLMTAR